MDALTKGIGKVTALHGVASRSGTGGAKVGRNEGCPCGSGKKYKKCCLT